MRNLNPLICGMTGSGKTTLARVLLSLAPRAFVFDPADDYEDGAVFESFRPAFEFYERNAREDFHLIYRGPRDTYDAWLDILYKSQRYMELPPLAIFQEEASYYSSSHNIDEGLDQIYTKGRRQGISVVTVVQRDTQINPIIRANSQVWVAMQQKNFSSDMKSAFTLEEREQIQTLETFTPFVGEPIEGKHYLVDRIGFDLFGSWKRIQTGG